MIMYTSGFCGTLFVVFLFLCTLSWYARFFSMHFCKHFRRQNEDLVIDIIVSCIGVCYTHVVLDTHMLCWITFCLILCDKRCGKRVFLKSPFCILFCCIDGIRVC